MFIGFFNRSCLLTYLGAAAAVVGFWLAVCGNVRFSVLCLAVCGVCDLFDGVIARRCKRNEQQKKFGIQIDSLVDMISFVMLPFAIFTTLGMTEWYNIVLCVFYALAAVTRLGYFNISSEETPSGYYSGLPVTFASLIFSALWLCSTFLDASALAAVMTAAVGIVALLFVLNIKIPKPRGAAYIFLGVLAIGVIAAILLIGD